MSRRREVKTLVGSRMQAPIFAALGDLTRLKLIGRLSRGQPCSIVQLTEDFKLTRQAITKHLRVLEDVGLVQGERLGREIRFQLVPAPLEQAKAYLGDVATQWEAALSRLKAFVETPEGESK